MQPTTADDQPNILADIKRDHASFFSLRRQMNEPNVTDEQKQHFVWKVWLSHYGMLDASLY
jgi:hypothetical protein